MKLHNVEQGTPEWFALREKRMTASKAQQIGNNGKGLDTYINTMMAEYYSSAEVVRYDSKDTLRGKELEPQAREMYELLNDKQVEEVGFVEYSKYVGCSPDGLVGDDGLVEIKCHNDLKHFKLILNGEKEIDSGYIWQMQMQMLVTGRKWCDLVAYNPNYKESLLVFRIEPDEKKQKQLLQGFAAGEKLIKEIEKKYGKMERRSN